MKENISSI